MSGNINGIWIGENSIVAILNGLRIAYLRLEKDLLASILYHDTKGAIGVAYGHRKDEKHDYTAAIICDCENNFIKNNDDAVDFIKLHSSDKVWHDEQNNRLIYTTYNNKVFENVLAEKIETGDFERVNEVDNSLSVVEKMKRWNMKAYCQVNTKNVRAGIDTQKYSIFYDIDWSEDGEKYGADEFIYCRVGQMGYCEKGWAMLPIFEVRHHRARMLDDNLATINDYKPNADWFVDDSCNFPEDGGWYWAIKEETDDFVRLQGCGGEIYTIHRYIR